MPFFRSPLSHPDVRRPTWRRKHGLHNFLVLLLWTAHVPLPLCVVLVAALAAPSVLVYADPLVAGIVLGAAVVGDLVLLLLLPRRRLSFGWIGPPWLMFTAGRALFALLAGLLPLPGPVQLVVLAVVQAGLSTAVVYGHVVEPFRVEDTDLTIPMPGLAAPLDVLLLTDLHMERWTRRETETLDIVKRRAPDLILVGGDFSNLGYVGDPETVAE